MWSVRGCFFASVRVEEAHGRDIERSVEGFASDSAHRYISVFLGAFLRQSKLCEKPESLLALYSAPPTGAFEQQSRQATLGNRNAHHYIYSEPLHRYATICDSVGLKSSQPVLYASLARLH